ncbi:MAG: thioredoxin family protein [Armatimonadota bacterium]
MREPLLALGVLIVAAGAVWIWLAWRWHQTRRAGAADLVAAYRATRARALVLAFTTPECVPCKTVQRPALDTLEQRYPGRVVIGEVNALDEPNLAARFAILTVPSTVVISQDGRIRAINIGTATTEQLAAQAGLNGQEGTPQGIDKWL